MLNITDQGIYKLLAILFVGGGCLVQWAVYSVRTDSNTSYFIVPDSAVKIITKDSLKQKEVEDQIRHVKIDYNQSCSSASLVVLISLLSISIGFVFLISIPIVKKS